MALTPTELRDAVDEAKELWKEVQNGTLPLDEVEPVRAYFTVRLYAIFSFCCPLRYLRSFQVH